MKKANFSRVFMLAQVSLSKQWKLVETAAFPKVFMLAQFSLAYTVETTRLKKLPSRMSTAQ